MTVETLDVVKTYKPGSAMAAEAIPFQFLDPADIVVTHIADATGARTLLSSGDDYSIAGDGMAVPPTGTITATASWPADDLFEVARATGRTQPEQVPAHQPIPSRALQRALDRTMLAVQEQDEDIAVLDSRSLRVPVGETVDPFPAKSLRKLRYIGFDAVGALALMAGVGPSVTDTSMVAYLATETAVMRTLTGKLAETVSVKDFGAVGDGVADDYAAFKAAKTFVESFSNGVSGGGLVYAPQGRYRIAGTSGDQTLKFHKTNVGLVGDGPQATILDFQNGAADCIQIGHGSVANSRGQEIAKMYLGQTGKTGGTMLRAQNCFNAIIHRVQTENNFVAIEVLDRCNSITLEDIFASATQGAAPKVLRFVAGASNAERSDVLAIRNVVLTGQWSDATCFEWDGAAYTVTVQSLRMLHAKYGMIVQNSAASASWYPSFLNAHDIEAEGFKQRALWIKAGAGFKISSSDFNNLSGGDPSQGSADLAAVQFDPDTGASYTRSIQIYGTRMGGTQREGLVNGARDVALGNCIFYTTSYAGSGNYPVIRATATCQDFQLSNIRGEEFGGAARASYLLTLGAGAQRVTGVDLNAVYCVTGAISDQSGNLTNSFVNVTKPNGAVVDIRPAGAINEMSLAGPLSVGSRNLATGASVEARWTLATGTANAFRTGSVFDNSGAPYYVENGGSAITEKRDQMDLHIWQTNAGTEKASLDTSGFKLPSGKAIYINATQVVGGRGAAVTAPTGGATVDAEARTAISAVISRLQAHGLIA